MKFTPREATLGLLTVGTALFAATGMMAGPRIQEWKQTSAELKNTKRRISSSQRLLAQREKWAGEFARLSGMLPRYPADKNVDIHWLSKMDEIAGKRGVTITRREVREEKKMGDVYELPIECRDWYGSLQAIKDFLVDLEAQGAMLDMRQLLIKPKSHDVLRGRFSLYCAYTREQETER